VDALPAGSPVDVVTDAEGVNPDLLAQTFRVVLPEERIASVRFPVRTPTLDGRRVVLLVKEYSRDFGNADATMPERRAAPGVIVLSGPVPVPPLQPAAGPRLGAGTPELLGIGVLCMLLLGGLGIGWSWAAFGGMGTLPSIAAAPGVGLAVVVADGLVLDAVGVRITGGWAAIVLVASCALGLALAARKKPLALRQRGPHAGAWSGGGDGRD
jgi:hypothetical protein